MTIWQAPAKPEKHIYEYAVHPDATRYEFRSVFSTDAGYWLAEEAAEDFFHKHEGWDCEWPLAFLVYSNGAHLGTWSVDMESRPAFSALQIDLAPASEICIQTSDKATA